MKKKVLIAVDGSRQSENALRYAALYDHPEDEREYVLFHVQPTISQYLVDEARFKPKARAELNKLKQRSEAAGRSLLDDCRSQLIDLGVAENRIQQLTLPRQVGVAKDILAYGTAMLYDAILIGRRGLSGLAELVMGSVSANLVDYSELIPIWMVDGKIDSRDVMLAVDGSNSALRAVDHMAFILGNAADVKITFYHVAPRLNDYCPVDFEDDGYDALQEAIREGDQACIDRFFAHARQKLEAMGIGEDRIHIDSREGVLRVGKSILKAYREGGYGTLIIGRRGMDKKFFTGSVSRYLINHFSDGALWVVP
ncbi:MAG: universal stress protein [Desulfosarcina sp.]|jgi:nucleotide-binding universal stress UspA family protein